MLFVVERLAATNASIIFVLSLSLSPLFFHTLTLSSKHSTAWSSVNSTSHSSSGSVGCAGTKTNLAFFFCIVIFCFDAFFLFVDDKGKESEETKKGGGKFYVFFYPFQTSTSTFRARDLALWLSLSNPASDSIPKNRERHRSIITKKNGAVVFHAEISKKTSRERESFLLLFTPPS